VDFYQNGTGSINGMDGAQNVTISPDGAHVYVTGYNNNALAVFNRNSTTGTLSFVEFHQDGVNSVDGLASPYGIKVSPDGRNVYVAGVVDSAIAVFNRNSTDGTLSFIEFHIKPLIKLFHPLFN